jgi:Putative restriction endonuclease
MAIERQAQTWPLYPVAPWPPDDTEESVLGTDLHQTTIRNLVLGINVAAHTGRQRDEPSPWRALTQLEYLGCKRPDGSAYRTYPDLFVFRHAIDPLRGSFTLEIDGPPVLIVEVLSESTYKADLSLERGKGYSYRQVGAPEYLVLDPTYSMLAAGMRGWRLAEAGYRAWEPAADGRLYSAQLPLAFALEGAQARVYLSDGRAMLREEEIGDALAQRDEELERLRRLLAERR